jgi:hypothetical protein
MHLSVQSMIAVITLSRGYSNVLSLLQARLRWLAAVADSVRNLAGGSLIAALESAAAHGEPIVR